MTKKVYMYKILIVRELKDIFYFYTTFFQPFCFTYYASILFF